MTLVVPADVVLWLTGWLRSRLEVLAGTFGYCSDVVVRDREPSEGEFPARLVVVSLAASVDTSVITTHVDVSLSTLAATKENPQECDDLARMVHALMRDSPGRQPGNPIAAVVASNGPYPVPEDQPRARRLSTFTLATVGTVI